MRGSDKETRDSPLAQNGRSVDLNGIGLQGVSVCITIKQFAGLNRLQDQKKRGLRTGNGIR